MLAARPGKEIVVRARNRVGLLFEVTKLLSEKGLTILAVSGEAQGEEGLIRLITDDNLRGREALSQRGYQVHEQDVILMELPHKPGMLRRVAEALTTESIGIQYAYATALGEQEQCLLVFHTDNDQHALTRLKDLASPVAVAVAPA
jgi:hypothetical protein